MFRERFFVFGKRAAKNERESYSMLMESSVRESAAARDQGQIYQKRARVYARLSVYANSTDLQNPSDGVERDEVLDGVDFDQVKSGGIRGHLRYQERGRGVRNRLARHEHRRAIVRTRQNIRRDEGHGLAALAKVKARRGRWRGYHILDARPKIERAIGRLQTNEFLCAPDHLIRFGAALEKANLSRRCGLRLTDGKDLMHRVEIDARDWRGSLRRRRREAGCRGWG